MWTNGPSWRGITVKEALTTKVYTVETVNGCRSVTTDSWAVVLHYLEVDPTAKVFADGKVITT